MTIYKKFNIPDQSKGSQNRENFIKKNYSEFYQYLSENFPNYLSFSEKLYWYRNNIDTRPVCKYCGGFVNFINPHKGYVNYCCSKCFNNSPDVIAKKRQTKLERYGDPNFTNYEKTKRTKLERYGDPNFTNYEKTKRTNLERYGVESTLQTEDVKTKTMQTCLKKYGVKHHSQCNKIKEKTKRTNLERYGVEFVLQSKEIKEKAGQTKLEKYGDKNYSNRKKAQQTNLERYGVETTFSNNIIKEKSKKSMLERYGVEYAQQNKDIVKKSKETLRHNITSKYNNIIDASYGDNYTYTCLCHHPECNKCEKKQFTIDADTYWIRKHAGVELCTKLLPPQQNYSKGTTLELFIRRILDEYSIIYIENDKTILDNYKELDIYIPSKKIAIECNGLYWHFQKYKDYHKNKFIECQQKGIRLITVWEDWIRLKPNILKSLILSILGIFKEKIYASECVVKKITQKQSSYFLNQNHIQGNTSSVVRYGLFHNDKLIHVMTFGLPKYRNKQRKNNGNNWELLRSCSLINTQVIGADEKILNQFIKDFIPDNITFTIYNDIDNIEPYIQLGFIQKGVDDSYWYMDEKTLKRYHESTFIKLRQNELKKDHSLTDDQIMRKNKFYKIYDSGQTKCILKVKQTE